MPTLRNSGRRIVDYVTYTAPASFLPIGCQRLARRQPFSSSAVRPSTASESTTTSIPSRTDPSPPPASGLARLTSRRLISVSGPDAAKYLQGAITSSIAQPDGSPRRAGFYSAFLNAQGRMLHDVFIYPDTILSKAGGQGKNDDGDAFLIEVDAGDAPRLERHIRRYRLRAKFNVRLLDEGEVGVWHAWEADDTAAPDSGDAAPGEAQVMRGFGNDGVVVLRDPRAPGFGFRLLTPNTALPEPAAGIEAASEDEYRIRRYLAGVAEGPDELVPEAALPLESNLDLVPGAIDFHKGCYVGQELTIRTRHRGVVRKRVLPCALYAEDRAAPTALAYRPDDVEPEEAGFGGAQDLPVGGQLSIGRVGKSGRSAGKWLSGVGNVGLALCRLEIMTDVVLPGETALPTWTPEDEFVLQEKGEGRVRGGLRIKAFVPPWLKQGLQRNQQT